MEFVYSARNPQARVAYASFGAMHTVLETVLVGLPEPEARRLSEEIERLALALDARLNRHDAGSLFARINASQGREAVALGGFGKGYALDRVRKLLADAGVANALVNFGDSSVAAVGSHPFGDCWQVTAKAGGGTFRLKETSLSLSGLRPDGRAHIVDPKSRRTVSDSVVVAVEGRSAFVCEILSTALYAAPAGARQGIAAEFEGYRHTEIKQHTESWTEENL